jgi:hypothetical protein
MPPGQNYQGSHYENTPWIFGAPVVFQKGFSTASPGNPAPTVTTPAIAATTVAVTNTNPFNVFVYVNGAAAVTVIKVNGVTTGAVVVAGGSAGVYLPAGATIALTYASTAPTWTWNAI